MYMIDIWLGSYMLLSQCIWSNLRYLNSIQYPYACQLFGVFRDDETTCPWNRWRNAQNKTWFLLFFKEKYDKRKDLNVKWWLRKVWFRGMLQRRWPPKVTSSAGATVSLGTCCWTFFVQTLLATGWLNINMCKHVYKHVYKRFFSRFRTCWEHVFFSEMPETRRCVQCDLDRSPSRIRGSQTWPCTRGQSKTRNAKKRASKNRFKIYSKYFKHVWKNCWSNSITRSTQSQTWSALHPDFLSKWTNHTLLCSKWMFRLCSTCCVLLGKHNVSFRASALFSCRIMSRFLVRLWCCQWSVRSLWLSGATCELREFHSKESYHESLCKKWWNSLPSGGSTIWELHIAICRRLSQSKFVRFHCDSSDVIHDHKILTRLQINVVIDFRNGIRQKQDVPGIEEYKRIYVNYTV